MLRQLFQHFTKPVSQEFCENWAILDQDRLVNYARLQAGSATSARGSCANAAEPTGRSRAR